MTDAEKQAQDARNQEIIDIFRREQERKAEQERERQRK